MFTSCPSLFDLFLTSFSLGFPGNFTSFRRRGLENIRCSVQIQEYWTWVHSLSWALKNWGFFLVLIRTYFEEHNSPIWTGVVDLLVNFDQHTLMGSKRASFSIIRYPFLKSKWVSHSHKLHFGYLPVCKKNITFKDISKRGLWLSYHFFSSLEKETLYKRNVRHLNHNTKHDMWEVIQTWTMSDFLFSAVSFSFLYFHTSCSAFFPLYALQRCHINPSVSLRVSAVATASLPPAAIRNHLQRKAQEATKPPWQLLATHVAF